MNTDQLEKFLGWMCERQKIFKRRFVEDEEPPWTEDEVLREHHFCNVYRELDAGTQYLLENIVDNSDNRDVFFNIVWYRFLNNPESYEAAGGFTPVGDFCPPQIVDRLEAWSETHSVFSPAYRVSAHRFADSESKIENIVYGIIRDDVIGHLDAYLSDLLHADDMAECFDALKQITAVGDFLAYELLTDLNYSFLPYTENDFVNVGPGAAKGLDLIFEEPEEDHIWWLMKNQDELFDKYNLDFWYWNGDHEKRLTLRDFEHSLCEFQKYVRAQQGEGTVRLFDPYGGDQQTMTEFL